MTLETAGTPLSPYDQQKPAVRPRPQVGNGRLLSHHRADEVRVGLREEILLFNLVPADAIDFQNPGELRRGVQNGEVRLQDKLESTQLPALCCCAKHTSSFELTGCSSSFSWRLRNTCDGPTMGICSTMSAGEMLDDFTVFDSVQWSV